MSVTPQQMGAIVEKQKAPMMAPAKLPKKKKPAAGANSQWSGVAQSMLASGLSSPKAANGAK